MKGNATNDDIGCSEDRHLEDKPADALAHPIHTVSRCRDPKDMPGSVSAVIHFSDGKRGPQPQGSPDSAS
jgi:hypothetical protein